DRAVRRPVAMGVVVVRVVEEARQRGFGGAGRAGQQPDAEHGPAQAEQPASQHACPPGWVRSLDGTGASVSMRSLPDDLPAGWARRAGITTMTAGLARWWRLE